mmetsp:Transcript_8151/g.20241  ORF Transcript_8151/g.20241 Transcript_8151/m.20241 type:complete len:607 (-) Transcript_8151:3439-5259(-)
MREKRRLPAAGRAHEHKRTVWHRHLLKLVLSAFARFCVGHRELLDVCGAEGGPVDVVEHVLVDGVGLGAEDERRVALHEVGVRVELHLQRGRGRAPQELREGRRQDGKRLLGEAVQVLCVEHLHRRLLRVRARLVDLEVGGGVGDGVLVDVVSVEAIVDILFEDVLPVEDLQHLLLRLPRQHALLLLKGQIINPTHKQVGPLCLVQFRPKREALGHLLLVQALRDLGPHLTEGAVQLLRLPLVLRECLDHHRHVLLAALAQHVRGQHTVLIEHIEIVERLRQPFLVARRLKDLRARLQRLKLGHAHLRRQHALARKVSDQPHKEVILVCGDARELRHGLRLARPRAGANGARVVAEVDGHELAAEALAQGGEAREDALVQHAPLRVVLVHARRHVHPRDLGVLAHVAALLPVGVLAAAAAQEGRKLFHRHTPIRPGRADAVWPKDGLDLLVVHVVEVERRLDLRHGQRAVAVGIKLPEQLLGLLELLGRRHKHINLLHRSRLLLAQIQLPHAPLLRRRAPRPGPRRRRALGAEDGRGGAAVPSVAVGARGVQAAVGRARAAQLHRRGGALAPAHRVDVLKGARALGEVPPPPRGGGGAPLPERGLP